MIYLDRTKAINLLYLSNAGEVTESMILALLECVENGFDESDLEQFFSEEIVDSVLTSELKILDKEMTLIVNYQAEEYEFEVVVDTRVDVRDEYSRKELGKLIGNTIKNKITNHGEIISLKKA